MWLKDLSFRRFLILSESMFLDLFMWLWSSSGLLPAEGKNTAKKKKGDLCGVSCF